MPTQGYSDAKSRSSSDRYRAAGASLGRDDGTWADGGDARRGEEMLRRQGLELKQRTLGVGWRERIEDEEKSGCRCDGEDDKC